MDPSLLCKTFFVVGTAVNIGGTLVPSFREQIMNYGSRGTTPSMPAKEQKKRTLSLFEYVASIQVPHTWFTHYYVVSVLSSIFWGYQIYTRGSAFQLLATFAQPNASTMTVNQVFSAWVLMGIQGSRRLYESITLTRPSRSRMWAGLWLVGIAYYAVMGVSVWIEGVALLAREDPQESLLEIGPPSLKTFVAISIFVIASVAQHICHVYLANLKKYTLPQGCLFSQILCPHYTSECFIYVAIAIVSAPPSHLFNMTVFAGLGFVTSNLGVTADATKKWYVKEFGSENLVGRWRMVPYLY
ncbi:hypothetical protein PZA11_002360 [Diplocarpon coronariae]|nr:hypothetical protein JHW43_001504 [Diplocarpon mali]